MLSQEIRRRFLKFFKDHHHVILPSSSVVPHDDPTLLFTNAGMNQFKDVFLGKNQRDYQRAATAQKCIRAGGKHNDLENIGHTSRHLTFFEMLGNFSFGDYFKKEAISFAWKVSTDIFQFEPEKIWVSVFRDDEEAYELWRPLVPEKRIVRLDEADNFWAMGETGPCGPCSELYYDRGPAFGNGPFGGERHLEFWNLVFMQFNRDAAGQMTPLPSQSIDTGAGLERILSLKMGVDSVFGTDILKNLIQEIEVLSQKKYEGSLIPAFQVISDHIRSLAFAIADGAQPSNIERGYVLRKLLRRSVRYGRMLGFQEPFLALLLPRLIDIMGEDYPELINAKDRISEILTLEEESFLRTLKRGGNILNAIIENGKKSDLQQISGEEAFRLKDTYGLPLEEILLIAKDMGLSVDTKSYQLLEEKARATSRAARTLESQEAKTLEFQDLEPTQFIGYEKLHTKAKVKALIRDGKFVSELTGKGGVILDVSPFYAEKGGQVGDTGILVSGSEVFHVSTCQSPYPGITLHLGQIEGTLRIGDPVDARVDELRRTQIQNNHTATHLLHFALEKVLGAHIRQAGSVVEAQRLRFDFNHHKPVLQSELLAIEDLVNDKIRENRPVQTYELSYEAAQQDRQIKQFFGDKYGKSVRVVDIDFSKELCGGTHASQTGSIGYFRILKEGSIAAGVRRIEAVSGKEAETLARQEKIALEKQLSETQEDLKKLQQLLKATRRTVLRSLSHSLVPQALSLGAHRAVIATVEAANDEFSLIYEDVLAEIQSGIVILANKTDSRCSLVVKVSSDLVQKGIQAINIVREIAPIVQGSGGGKADLAQAGGKDPSKLPEALEKARLLVTHLLR